MNVLFEVRDQAGFFYNFLNHWYSGSDKKILNNQNQV